MKNVGALAGVFCALACPLHGVGAAAAKPNIVLFLADDLGYGDVGCYGSDRVRTPRLDRLAAEGIRFTQFYAPGASCSPTRTGIMTGRNPCRLGVYTYIPQNSAMHMKRGEITIASLLRDAGYARCFVGKWACNGSLTDPSQPQPDEHGFDHWLASQNNAIPSHKDPDCFVRNGSPAGPIRGYSAQSIVDEANPMAQGSEARRQAVLPVCLVP